MYIDFVDNIAGMCHSYIFYLMRRKGMQEESCIISSAKPHNVLYKGSTIFLTLFCLKILLFYFGHFHKPPLLS